MAGSSSLRTTAVVSCLCVLIVASPVATVVTTAQPAGPTDGIEGSSASLDPPDSSVPAITTQGTQTIDPTGVTDSSQLKCTEYSQTRKESLTVINATGHAEGGLRELYSPSFWRGVSDEDIEQVTKELNPIPSQREAIISVLSAVSGVSVAVPQRLLQGITITAEALSAYKTLQRANLLDDGFVDNKDLRNTLLELQENSEKINTCPENIEELMKERKQLLKTAYSETRRVASLTEPPQDADPLVNQAYIEIRETTGQTSDVLQADYAATVRWLRNSPANVSLARAVGQGITDASLGTLPANSLFDSAETRINTFVQPNSHTIYKINNSEKLAGKQKVLANLDIRESERSESVEMYARINAAPDPANPQRRHELSEQGGRLDIKPDGEFGDDDTVYILIRSDTIAQYVLRTGVIDGIANLNRTGINAEVHSGTSISKYPDPSVSVTVDKQIVSPGESVEVTLTGDLATSSADIQYVSVGVEGASADAIGNIQNGTLFTPGDSVGNRYGFNTTSIEYPLVEGFRRNVNPSSDPFELSFQLNPAETEGTISLRAKSTAKDGEVFISAPAAGTAPRDQQRESAKVTEIQLQPAPGVEADAGENQSVTAQSTVILDATKSTNTGDDALTYEWTQLSGPSVSLTDASTATPEFTAPEIETSATLTFEVTVSNGESTDTDRVNVTIKPENRLPIASATFENQTVPSGTQSVIVGSAQFGNQSVPGEEFVVVVHETIDGGYGTEIGPKVGESAVLSPGTRQNVTVDLNTTLGASDSIAELTSSQSLVAMLHRANTTDDDEITHGSQIRRDGDAVTSRAQITVLSQLVDVSPSDLPGDGSESDPYEISNVSELQAMEDDLDANYELVSDINASRAAQINGGSGFDPVGGPAVGLDENTPPPFTGRFDGNNQTITDLTITRPDERYVGLFGVTYDGATMKNITLANVTVTGDRLVGGLVGSNNFDGTIRNASASGSVTGESNVGGLVGRNSFDGTIKNATSSVSVTGDDLVGGVAGDNSGMIQTAAASGNVIGTGTGDSDVGGLVGHNDGTIQTATASGSVTGESNVGGLVGENGVPQSQPQVGDNPGTVTDASASGTVTGDNNVGGLVGTNHGGRIQNATASGTVTGDNNVGGLVGANIGRLKMVERSGSTYQSKRISRVTIRHTFAVGAVSGNSDVGGLVGNNTIVGATAGTTDTIDESYFDTQTTGQSTSAGSAAGLTTAEMQGQVPTSYMDLAFGTAWQTVAGDYPTLLRFQQDTDQRSDGGDDPLEVDVSPSDLSGDGSPSNPYQISNVFELQAMEDDLDANYELVSDIDASQMAQTNDGRGFDPVGGVAYRESTPPPFSGSFDGNTHTVVGTPHLKTIDRPNQNFVGLFGVAGSKATIRDITLIGWTVTGDSDVGGLVGHNDGTIQTATVSGSVTGDRQVGGLVGGNQDGTIKNATSSVSVTGDTEVGGVAGDNSGMIQTAAASGNVIGTGTGGSDTGGLVGTNSGTIQTAAASGSVDGTGPVGGLVGYNGNFATIQNVTASGSVSGDPQLGVGGLVGSNENTVRDAFAVGSVTDIRRGADAYNEPGGLVGDGGGTVDQSYFDRQATDQSTSAGNAIGLTTAQMQGHAATENMDLAFGETWQTASGDYPELIALANSDSDSESDPPPDTDTDTVTVGGQEVPIEFTSETASGERTVTARNAIDVIDAFRNDNADVSTVLSVIDAFRTEQQL